MIQIFLHICMLAAHPIHVSVTEIAFDKPEKELEITSRIFIDDLETSIRNELNLSTLDLLKPVNGQTTEKLIGQYIRKHVVILLDGKAQPIKYLGQEVEGDALVCYMIVPDVKSFSTIKIQNDIIMELYPDQSNLVHITREGKTRSMRLQQDKLMDQITF